MIAEPKILLRPDMAAGTLQGTLGVPVWVGDPLQLESIRVHRVRFRRIQDEICPAEVLHSYHSGPGCQGTLNTNFGLT